VVVDHPLEFGDDRLADLVHVVQPVELPGQAAEEAQLLQRLHLHRVARPTGATGLDGGRVARRAVLATALGRIEGGVGGGEELGHVGRVARERRDSARDGGRPDAIGERAHAGAQPVGGRPGGALSGLRKQDRELLAADPAGDVAAAQALHRSDRDAAQDDVALLVPVQVVQELEVVEVERDQRERPPVPLRPVHLAAHPLVEESVVAEPRQEVCLSLLLELMADARVVERQREQVGEAPDQVELLVGERRELAQPVGVERADRAVAHDERHDHQRLALVGRRARHDLDPGIVVRRRQVLGRAVLDGPSGQALADAKRRRHDLVGPHVD
jgi:hypothetical protein